MLPNPTLIGPAHLDLADGIAHKSPTCSRYVLADFCATADDGEMTGFVWCDECGGSDFVPAVLEAAVAS